MKAIKLDNDNVPRYPETHRRGTKLTCKMEYFPRSSLRRVGSEATHQAKMQPLRVLMVKLEDEI